MDLKTSASGTLPTAAWAAQDPFRGRKRSLYEGGTRVPFILSWPAGGTAMGKVDNDTPLCAVDLLPTFCTLAGVPLPDNHGSWMVRI